MNNTWRNKKTEELFKTFLQLKSLDEMAAFCRDLMTESEIAELAGRWDVAKALDAGKSQREVSAETGVSIATVTRVNQWLKRGENGYRLVLNKMSEPKESPEKSTNLHWNSTLLASTR